MEIEEIDRCQDGMQVLLDNKEVYFLQNVYLKKYYEDRLVYSLFGKQGTEPCLKDYVLKFGQKVKSMSDVSSYLSSFQPRVAQPQADQSQVPAVATPAPTPNVSLSVWAIMNEKGQWLQRLSNDRHWPSTWVDDISDAKIWIKAGQAKATVTRYTRINQNQLPVPNLVKLTTTVTEVYDEAKRIQEANERKKQATIRREQAKRKRLVDVAKREFDLAKARYESLMSQFQSASDPVK
jgi:hypothetical protein